VLDVADHAAGAAVVDVRALVDVLVDLPVAVVVAVVAGVVVGRARHRRARVFAAVGRVVIEVVEVGVAAAGRDDTHPATHAGIACGRAHMCAHAPQLRGRLQVEALVDATIAVVVDAVADLHRTRGAAVRDEDVRLYVDAGLVRCVHRRDLAGVYVYQGRTAVAAVQAVRFVATCAKSGGDGREHEDVERRGEVLAFHHFTCPWRRVERRREATIATAASAAA